MAKKETNELETLLPETEVTVAGEVIEIRPFHFAKLPKVIELITSFGTAIFGLFNGTSLQFDENNNVKIDQTFVKTVGKIVEEHFPEVVELISVYTGKPSTFYLDEKNDFDYEQGILLIARIVNKNIDFFTTRLSQVTKGIHAKIKK
jgi:hypothetical protein